MKFNRYTLSDLATIKYGKNQKKVLSDSGTVPIFGTGGFMGFATTSLYDKPSVLIGRKGTIGKVKYVEQPFWTVDTLFYTIINTDLVIPKYLFYVMSLIDLNNYNEGTTIPSLRTETLNRLEFDIPDLEEQRKILSCLNPIDEKIELNNAINNNLQQQAAAIFRSWFVDCAPFGGKVPDEWENVTLEDITALVSRGITPKYADDTDQIVINQKCIRNHTIDLSLARTHTPKVVNEKWLRFGDLLINSTGDGTLGRAAQVWFRPQKLTVDSHVTIARPAKENLIFYIGLWGILHEKEIEALHTGSTGQTELPRDRVKAMELLLPDNDTLDRFTALITPMAAAIVANQEENNRLAALRDAVLPKLMSGEIDVSAVQF